MSFFRTTRLRSRKQKTQLESEEPEELLSERLAGKEGKGHIEKPYRQSLSESKAGKHILILQNKPETLHPLHKNLHLLVCHVSGLHYSKEIYQTEQFKLL